MVKVGTVNSKDVSSIIYQRLCSIITATPKSCLLKEIKQVPINGTGGYTNQ